MTTTILLEVPVKMIDVVKKLERPLSNGELSKKLEMTVVSLSVFPGHAWEIADNLPGPHPVPTLDGKLVTAVIPLKEYNQWTPTGKEQFRLTLEDGTEETVIWDDPRLDDPDEILVFWDERFAEFE